MVNGVLDYSKIEAGKVTLEKKEFNLIELIENTCSFFYNHAREKNIEIYIKIDNNVPDKVIADALRIKQVLLNVIGNAVKYTNEGEIKIECRMINKTEKECDIEFSVEDTGIVIAKENIDRIFKEYEQANIEITEKYGGTLS